MQQEAKPLYYDVLPATDRARSRPKKIAQGRKDLVKLIFFTVLMIIVLGMLEDRPDPRPTPAAQPEAALPPRKPLLLW